MNYSIGIVTYVKRFEKYFKPLIDSIKTKRPDLEIIVCVNGEYKQKFDENYRKQILNFISEYENIYPTFHPQFRSLSKLWNTCLINSSNKMNLILNDDITIESDIFFYCIEKLLKNGDQSFKINGSWSHTLLNREEIDKVGWFDERFLGVGEEDGDMEWRWGRIYQKQFNSVYIPGIINHVEQKECLQDMRIQHNKYSKFNYDFVLSKYKKDDNGVSYGIMNEKLKCINESPYYHQAEKFYWDNKDKL